MTEKKCTKKRDARAELLFCQSIPFAFLPSSLMSPSLLKFPNPLHFTGVPAPQRPLPKHYPCSPVPLSTFSVTIFLLLTNKCFTSIISMLPLGRAESKISSPSHQLYYCFSELNVLNLHFFMAKSDKIP